VPRRQEAQGQCRSRAVGSRDRGEVNELRRQGPQAVIPRLDPRARLDGHLGYVRGKLVRPQADDLARHVPGEQVGPPRGGWLRNALQQGVDRTRPAGHGLEDAAHPGRPPAIGDVLHDRGLAVAVLRLEPWVQAGEQVRALAPEERIPEHPDRFGGLLLDPGGSGLLEPPVTGIRRRHHAPGVSRLHEVIELVDRGTRHVRLVEGPGVEPEVAGVHIQRPGWHLIETAVQAGPERCDPDLDGPHGAVIERISLGEERGVGVPHELHRPHHPGLELGPGRPERDDHEMPAGGRVRPHSRDPGQESVEEGWNPPGRGAPDGPAGATARPRTGTVATR
jgi:hypothetical protein